MSSTENPREDPYSDSNDFFPIVGIGASAGGLQALQEFFSQVTADSKIAYLVLVHAAAENPHLLPEILQNSTSLPVRAAENNDPILPNHVYLIPPQTAVNFQANRIQLMPIEREKVLLSIDIFFNALAEAYSQRAAGIILSGMGTDGTLGVTALKAKEALVLVQSEETASYPEMPASAAADGIVDAILPPLNMPRTIERYFEQRIFSDEEITAHEWLSEIFTLLCTEIGHDFSSYKKNTLIRRINRRMNLYQIETYRQYLDFLRNSPKEVNTLFREFLIGVTSFFRDPSAFELLQNEILPPILNALPENGTFRVWVPGCSTGEEVYSLAIILREILDEMPQRIDLQLFGTDIDQLAIDRAREGVYPANIATKISEQRLRHFFEPEGQFYRVGPQLRYSVVFSLQDVLKDPPFSRLNLLTCRNLLIYLNESAQKRLLPLFHYTLKPSGILMLGSSESIGSFNNLFRTLDSRYKIFQRREVAQSLRYSIQFPTGSSLNFTPSRRSLQSFRQTEETNLQSLVQDVLLEEFCPTAVLIESNGLILHVQGRTGKFLETVSGPPTNNIIDMAREGLRIELASAIRAAAASNNIVTRQQIPIRSNGNVEVINFSVKPLTKPERLADRLLILFERVEPRPNNEYEANPAESAPLQQRDARIAELEKELQNTRESHQTTIEELESSNEELQATNEELESSNEELKATNEELESSKEELQSLNEELQTLNEELQTKVEELSAAEDDMHNLLNSTEIATIFVDREMRVKRFTPQATQVINLIQNDVGRPLAHIATKLENAEITTDLEEVLATLTPIIKMVQANNGKWYFLRIMPYHTIDNRVDGATLTFTNIDELKAVEQQLETLTIDFEQLKLVIKQLLEANSTSLVLLNSEKKIVDVNQAFYNLINRSPNESLEAIEQGMIEQLEEPLNTTEDFFNIPWRTTLTGQSNNYLIDGKVIGNDSGGSNYFLLSIRQE